LRWARRAISRSDTRSETGSEQGFGIGENVARHPNVHFGSKADTHFSRRYCFSRYPVRNIQAITARQTPMIASVTAALDHTGTSATE